MENGCTVAIAKETGMRTLQSLPVSPGWARALPSGPDTRVKITEAYASLVARDVYFWTWPMVTPRTMFSE
jgi:hypothetical protein